MSTNPETLYIGGAWAKPAGTKRLEIINATTEQKMGSVPEATNADVDRAVAAAKAAFPTWSKTTPQERAAVLNRFADAVQKRVEQLTETVTQQNGMPLSLADALEGGFPIALLRYYAHLATTTNFEETRPSPMGVNTLVRREAIGVVAGIVPWNYPVVLAMSKIAPALAAGCTIVLKPSPGTVLDSYVLAEAAHEANVPKGVINWVPRS